MRVEYILLVFYPMWLAELMLFLSDRVGRIGNVLSVRVGRIGVFLVLSKLADQELVRWVGLNQIFRSTKKNRTKILVRVNETEQDFCSILELKLEIALTRVVIFGQHRRIR